MKLSIITPGRFHSFDLAAQLYDRGCLDVIYTGYPLFKLKSERTPRSYISSQWMGHAPLMALGRLGLPEFVAPLQQRLFRMADDRLDRRVRGLLGDVDGVIALSGSGLLSGREVQHRGGFYVCDRGSSHITFQDAILREEAVIVGLPARGVDAWTIERELAEYDAADAIFTPSDFTYQTFVDRGVEREKLKLLPYGVNTAAFSPGRKAETFTVLFAGQTGYRKGIHYLLKAWRRLGLPGAQLRIAGGVGAEFAHLVKWAGGMPDGVILLGHLDRPTLAREMAAAHVLVLPSIEEGLALVMAQAMACRTPVIATANTGATTLFRHGTEGLIGPIRSVDFLCEALTELASNPALLSGMSEAALARSASFGTVGAYGERAREILGELDRARRNVGQRQVGVTTGRRKSTARAR